MGDRAVPKGKGRRKAPKNQKIDTWFGMMPEQQCIFCNHSLYSHGGNALQIRKPGMKNRTRIGVRLIWCKECANSKNTHQVVCYKVSEEFLQRIEAAGYGVFIPEED